jgi:serine kinase of HPr protein (carbohydrate metabolism regulator)
MSTATTVHASVAFVGGRGVLIRGASGSGKSSLLLALLDRDPDTRLVADDRVVLTDDGGRLVASVPDAIAGRMEIRGVGIVRRPHLAFAPLDLVVDLVAAAEAPRLPDADERMVEVGGRLLPRVFVISGAPDGAARVRAALAALFSQDIDIVE